MDLSNSRSWTENDLEALVENEVKESINLDYKSCGALQKKERTREEISKDVSAFANSAGGIIVYGMVETGHIPTAIDEGYDPGDLTREWLEQVIHGNIRPRINDVHINQIALSKSAPGRAAYVVTIPQGVTAHQAADLRYHKRLNFESVRMYDHEIRDVMNRSRFPIVTPEFVCQMDQAQSSPDLDQYRLSVTLVNSGAMRAKEMKLVLFWPSDIALSVSPQSYVAQVISREITVEGLRTDNYELSTPHINHTLFPEDKYELSREDSRFELVFIINPKALWFIRTNDPSLAWKIYADDMPPQSGKIQIVKLRGYAS